MSVRRISLIFVPYLLYVALAAPLLEAPLRWDETEWPLQAQAILRHGIPAIPFSESPYAYHEKAWLVPWGADYGLWHPPLYLYTLAGWIWLVGDSPAGVRLLGLICGVISLFFVTRIAKRLSPQKPEIAAMAASLTALNPFWVHGTLLADIDSTVLCPLLFAYCEQLLKFSEKQSPVRFATLAVILMFLLWCKLTTPVVVCGAFLAFLQIRTGSRVALSFVLSAVTGAALFVSTWIIFANLTGAPASFFLEYTYFGRTHELFRFRLWETANAIRFNVTQLSFPFTAIILAALIIRIRSYRTRRSTEEIDLFWITGFTILFFYTCIWTLFGKYTVMLVPVFAVASLSTIARLQWIFPIANLAKRLLPILLGTALYYALVVPDIIIGPSIARVAHAQNFSDAFLDPRIARYLLSGLPLVAICALLLSSRKRQSFVEEFTVLAFTTLISANLVQNLWLYPASYESNILTPSDGTGFMETVQFLHENTADGDRLLAAKEFAYYLPRAKIIPLDRTISFSSEYFPDLFDAGSSWPEYIVVFPRERIFQTFPQNVEPAYRQVYVTADFITLRRSDQ